MLKSVVQNLLGLGGLSLHRKSSIDRLIQDIQRLRERIAESSSPQTSLVTTPEGNVASIAQCQQLREALAKHESRQVFYLTTEDYGAHEKMEQCVDRIPIFGEADFADLSTWLFASSLINHRVIHQRIDEGSLLWQAVKMSAGPILEVGRAAGGSTIVLLAASGSRRVVSIDRAPFHAFITERVFRRRDVAPRLKLYRQTSREPIAETEFGMVFIDADHSYEGVCHDIAMFWNSLRSFDGRPPLAAFHDAAENPITFVEPVVQACKELLAEPGAARIVRSWGSMLVLEKIGTIDQDRWFKKENPGFWEQYANAEYPVLRPEVLRGRLRPDRHVLRLGSNNLLGDENVDAESWIKRGMEVERAQLNEDNPLRLLRETNEIGAHAIEKSIALDLKRFNYRVFIRPHHLAWLRLSVVEPTGTTLASVDFELTERSKIGSIFAKNGIDIIDAGFDFRNGYFSCELALSVLTKIPSASFMLNTLDSSGKNTAHAGNSDRGVWSNLSSVRGIL